MSIFHRYLIVCLSISLMETCNMSEIKIGVILPYNQEYPWSLQRVLPSIEMAIETISTDILPGKKVSVFFNDSMCSEIFAPMAAMDLHYTVNVNTLFGPVCDYALAPVAMFSSHWNIPVLTAGGLVSDFDDKTKFSYLTRVLGLHSNTADVFIEIAKIFNWKQFSLIYEDIKSGNGKSDCFYSMKVLYKKLRLEYANSTTLYQHFDNGFTEEGFKENLQSASSHSRIIVLCGSLESVREIMINAFDLNYCNGDYVFITYILPTSIGNSALPWYKEDDTIERNEKARRAYEALLIFSLRQPTGSEYNQFSEEVKRRAKMRYENITFGKSLRYCLSRCSDINGLALNETFEAGDSISNGAEVLARMKNRTFQGVTGKVSIDSNGDKQADYSLLDMDPGSGRFERISLSPVISYEIPKIEVFKVVLNYFGTFKMAENVQGKQIHWGGDSVNVPSDRPGCDLRITDCNTTMQSIKEEIERTTTKTETPENDVGRLLANLQLTLTKISKAVAEHNGSLLSITEVLEKQKCGSSVENPSCPQALLNSGLRTTDPMKTFLSLSILFACVLSNK